MNYSDGTKYFELQTYLLEYCKLRKSFNPVHRTYSKVVFSNNVDTAN